MSLLDGVEGLLVPAEASLAEDTVLLLSVIPS